MANTYNIYKVKFAKIDQLKEKLKSVGLVEQKTLEKDGYLKTFYFSEKVEGNEVWWWKAYRDFFNEGIEEPKNLFNFAVLVCQNITEPEKIFAVSLGKSHFYLSKFIQILVLTSPCTWLMRVQYFSKKADTLLAQKGKTYPLTNSFR